MAEMEIKPFGNDADSTQETTIVKLEENEENMGELKTVEKKRKRKPRVKSVEHVVKMKKNRRDRANDRERGRMHSLNDALEELREILPSGADGKMTKIDTLRTAYNYIWALSQTVKMLDTEPEKIAFMKMGNFNNDSCIPPMPSFIGHEISHQLSTYSSECSSPQLASPGSDTSDYSSHYDSQYVDSPVYSPPCQGQFFQSDSMPGNYMPALPYNNMKSAYPFVPNQGYSECVDIM